ncbi:uncharacterized protein LOC117119833 [Anneissia japonica]|uniref:uncharacterized protein LOC117119833 n=1 Tax=Anneissia japonica TaxID=1529436 RepID=UPI00142593C1|nr:uncharacterized protein LOC117119833 [Anneissia japonica]
MRKLKNHCEMDETEHKTDYVSWSLEPDVATVMDPNQFPTLVSSSLGLTTTWPSGLAPGSILVTSPTNVGSTTEPVNQVLPPPKTVPSPDPLLTQWDNPTCPSSQPELEITPNDSASQRGSTTSSVHARRCIELKARATALERQRKLNERQIAIEEALEQAHLQQLNIL